MKRKFLIGITVILISCITGFFLWWKGCFLPSWITWKDQRVSEDFDQDGRKETVLLKKNHLILKRGEKDLSETPDRWKISEMYTGDIDDDGIVEILVLAWRHGDYGAYHPDWVKHDTIRWSEHLYIFEIKDDQIKAQWMSSKLNPQIQKLKVNQDGSFTCTSPEQKKSVWKWQGYGVYRAD